MQGYRVHLELWKVLLEDVRWVGMSGPLDPTKFNPSRSIIISYTLHCCHLALLGVTDSDQ